MLVAAILSMGLFKYFFITLMRKLGDIAWAIVR